MRGPEIFRRGSSTFPGSCAPVGRWNHFNLVWPSKFRIKMTLGHENLTLERAARSNDISLLIIDNERNTRTVMVFDKKIGNISVSSSCLRRIDTQPVRWTNRFSERDSNKVTSYDAALMSFTRYVLRMAKEKADLSVLRKLLENLSFITRKRIPEKQS